jgi:hypothetical protein
LVPFFARAKKRSSTAEWLVKNAPAASGTLPDLGQARPEDALNRFIARVRFQ